MPQLPSAMKIWILVPQDKGGAMGIQQIRDDIRFLAGSLAHRITQTDGEREAARYIHRRLREELDDAGIEPFQAVDNQDYVTASCLAEFMVVALAAHWWPLAAFFYAAAVCAAYTAEYLGRPVLSRLLPRFESANVIGRHFAKKPSMLIVVTAHYDSGTASPLTAPHVAARMRWLHLALAAAMLTVTASCLAGAVLAWNGAANPAVAAVRWAAAAVLLFGAVVHFIGAFRRGEVRGANCNASGVAALLRLAALLRDTAPENADVWLAATGAHERRMAGMRELAAGLAESRGMVHFINIECVGAGALKYTTSEGILAPVPCGGELVAAARAGAAAFGFDPAALRAVETAAYMPLTRGMSAISLVGLGENGVPAHWNWFTDSLSEVDEESVDRAAAFALDILLRVSGGAPPAP